MARILQNVSHQFQENILEQKAKLGCDIVTIELQVKDPLGDILNYFKFTEPELLKNYKEGEDINSITLDYQKLKVVLPDVVDYLSNDYPSFVSEFRDAIKVKLGLKDISKADIYIKNYSATAIPISKIRQEYIGDLVNIDCIIRKTSNTRQEIKTCKFICRTCGKISPSLAIKTIKLRPPSGYSCADKSHKTFEAMLNTCEFEDVQYITIQEPQEQVTGGKQPESVMATLSGSMTDTLMAGNRCRVTGYVRVKQNAEDDKEVRLNIEVIGITKDVDDYNDVVLSPDDERQIRELSRNPDVFNLLSQSIAPTIYGYEGPKLAMVLQLFGGTSINLPDGTHIRGNSHILLCGDPALAKSQLIRNVCKLCPRGIYTSGKSTSAAGLTAAAVKDDIDGKWVVEAGALVLADGGMCIVDELDKMSEEDTSSLHEAMESQTISFNKAGISTTLYTRCSLLAAANPKASRFIDEMDLSSQLTFPSSLLTRFDLIFLMVDKPNAIVDRAVAKHMLGVRRNAELYDAGLGLDDDTGIKRPVNADVFRKYVSLSHRIKPVLTKETIKYLEGQYATIRNPGKEVGPQKDTRAITPRQLDALIRLSESSARVRLSDVVTIDDAKRAVEIWTASMKSISLDGTINVSTIDCDSNLNEMQRKIIRETKKGKVEGKALRLAVCADPLLDIELFNDNLIALKDKQLIEVTRENGQMYVSQYSQ